MKLNVVHERTDEEFIAGAIWKNMRTEQYYMLAEIDIQKYVLVNLETGKRFKHPVEEENIERAFKNVVGKNNFCRFVGTIELSQSA